ncbi:hypothetical protein [Candidatus Skiveiella danica]|jgi:hypothetical protein|uniref:hypothetical protein n=1 Tax=Candidatus Skiveiella danica TaxID=3386177 RepID=UPI0009D3F1FF|nr:MAG: hypothetical protein BWX79_02664 [Alphaproteobacteria bacterium ADurb.Bin100]
MKRTLTRLAVALLEYLLGFLALAVFAAVAFSAGAPTDERLIVAFKLGAVLAGVELAVLLVRAAPANRLIVGANAWLLAGGLAAFTEQWWWLKGYQHLGETSLFLSMLGVGIVATAFTPTGFVAAAGPRRKVVLASLAMLLAVGLAAMVSVQFRGDVKWAAVLPVIALSWLNRLAAQAVRKGWP